MIMFLNPLVKLVEEVNGGEEKVLVPPNVWLPVVLMTVESTVKVLLAVRLPPPLRPSPVAMFLSQRTA